MIKGKLGLQADIHSDRLRPLLKRRQPINHSAVPFALCWSQKAGCTAALKWYLHHAGLLQEALNFSHPNLGLDIHSYENKVLKAREGYLDDLVAAILSGKPLVGFMRCPYERAFSSYMILNHGRYPKLRRRGKVSPGMKIRQAVAGFVHGESTDMAAPIAFRDYLLWLQQQDMAALNPHHTPQHMPLHACVAVTLYRLVDFDTALDQLEQTYALASSAAERRHFSSGHHRSKVESTPSEIAAFLRQRLPMEAYPLSRLPRISRLALSGTQEAALIEDIFAGDITAYDSITPLAGRGQ